MVGADQPYAAQSSRAAGTRRETLSGLRGSTRELTEMLKVPIPVALSS